jgi:hypothetical protein
MVVRKVNLRKCVIFCFMKRNLTFIIFWKGVFSDENDIVIGINNRIFILCRRRDEEYRPDCISPRSHRKLSVVIWESITHHGVGTICCMCE